MTDISALALAVKLVADAAKDTEQVVKDGPGPLMALLDYRNLVGDLFDLVPKIGDIPAEAKALEPADYVALAGMLAADLGIGDPHIGPIVDASLALLTELVSGVLPKVEALVAAIKAPAPAAPAA